MTTEAGETSNPAVEEESGDESENEKENQKSSMKAEHWARVSHPVYEKPRLIPHSGSGESSDKVPAAIQTTLAAVAASIIYSATGMTSWGLAELTLGLYKVFCRHAREKVIDTIDGHLVTRMLELQDIAHYLKWAKAAYAEKTHLLAAEVEVDEKDIIEHQITSAFGQPAYFIALNHAKKAVMLSIRGTFSAIDVLTDLKPHSEPFKEGFAHSGMLKSAKWLREIIVDQVKELMAQNGFRLVVTGHSLGAGAASVLAMMLRETDDKGLTVLGVKPESVTCWAYACPPCVDLANARRSKYIKTIVNQDDIVCRISPAALENLRTEIVKTDWSHALEDGSTRRTVVALAQKSASAPEKIESALNLEKGALYANVKSLGCAAFTKIGTGLTESWNKAVEGSYGTGSKQTATILNKGAAILATQLATASKQVIESVNGAIDKQLKLIDPERTDATVTASSMAANAAMTNQSEGRALLEENRLYVPGSLYHIIRRPLEDHEKAPKTKKDGVNKNTAYRFMVIRGDHSSSRFKRIVLSSTMISAHLCPSIQEALANAMKWNLDSRGSTI